MRKNLNEDGYKTAGGDESTNLLYVTDTQDKRQSIYPRMIDLSTKQEM